MVPQGQVMAGQEALASVCQVRLGVVFAGTRLDQLAMGWCAQNTRAGFEVQMIATWFEGSIAFTNVEGNGVMRTNRRHVRFAVFRCPLQHPVPTLTSWQGLIRTKGR